MTQTQIINQVIAVKQKLAKGGDATYLKEIEKLIELQNELKELELAKNLQ